MAKSFEFYKKDFSKTVHQFALEFTDWKNYWLAEKVEHIFVHQPTFSLQSYWYWNFASDSSLNYRKFVHSRLTLARLSTVSPKRVMQKDFLS